MSKEAKEVVKDQLEEQKQRAEERRARIQKILDTDPSFYENEAADMISNCRMLINKNSPFWACLQSELGYTKDWSVDTMATDGRRVMYNPLFVVETLKNYNEIIFVMLHELLHCAMVHFDRRGWRDKRLFNIAADLAINPLIKGAHFKRDGITVQMPQSALFEEKYVGCATEVIYEDILNDKDCKYVQFDDCCAEGDGDGDGDGGEDGDGNGKKKGKRDSEYTGQFSEKWRDALKRAVSKCNEPGTGVTEELRSFVKELVAPQVNWKDALKMFIESLYKKSKTVMPNRRYISGNTYLWKEKADTSTGDIVICVDCSGSISDEALNVFVSECMNIIKVKKPQHTHIVWFHHVVDHVDTLRGANAGELKKPASGGTDFNPPLQWIEDNIVKKSKPLDGVVFITDGYASMPERPSFASKFMWVIVDDSSRNIQTPFGRRTDLKSDAK